VRIQVSTKGDDMTASPKGGCPDCTIRAQNLRAVATMTGRGQRVGAWLAAVLLLLASGGASTAAQPPAVRSPTARPVRPMLADAQQVLRDEAVAQNRQQREAAIRALIRLYQDAVTHPKLASSETLQRNVLRLRGRLRRVARQLRQAEDQGKSDQPGRQPEAARRPPEAKPRTRVLAQQQGGIRPVARGQGRAAALGQPQPADYGLALVDLIERTISPPIWDVNGGPATVVYFAPRHALVVRAPSPAQRDVSRLVRDLRQAAQ
jgi:hypothetical protein